MKIRDIVGMVIGTCVAVSAANAGPVVRAETAQAVRAETAKAVRVKKSSGSTARPFLKPSKRRCTRKAGAVAKAQPFKRIDKMVPLAKAQPFKRIDKMVPLAK